MNIINGYQSQLNIIHREYTIDQPYYKPLINNVIVFDAWSTIIQPLV